MRLSCSLLTPRCDESSRGHLGFATRIHPALCSVLLWCVCYVTRCPTLVKSTHWRLHTFEDPEKPQVFAAVHPPTTAAVSQNDHYSPHTSSSEVRARVRRMQHRHTVTFLHRLPADHRPVGLEDGWMRAVVPPPVHMAAAWVDLPFFTPPPGRRDIYVTRKCCQ